ncbi:hypothetical protein AAG570_000660 [Ranatra chinensis]|uniref:Mos1 transposase HTH domain-containing protein n=1 Tax=Ranatra chinensis TaxID=642074 RepID=A0ABD0YXP4_9HEMI
MKITCLVLGSLGILNDEEKNVSNKSCKKKHPIRSVFSYSQPFSSYFISIFYVRKKSVFLVNNSSVNCEKSSQETSSSSSIYRPCGIRSVIKFLILRREFAAEIHRQLVENYGPEVTLCQYVYDWVRSFKEGHTGIHDE